MRLKFVQPKFAVYSFVALVLAITLTNCQISDRPTASQPTGSQQAQSSPTATVAPSANSSDTTPTTAQNTVAEIDQRFIEMMIPHHQDATEMAEMALTRATNPEIKQLAQSIIDEQTREVGQMQQWYRQWYGRDVPETSQGMNGHQQMGEAMAMSMQEQDMMGTGMMEALRTAENFDQEFLRQMILHHQSATMMAGMVVDTARHPETRELARNIIQSQTEEITQMQQLLPQVASQ